MSLHNCVGIVIAKINSTRQALRPCRSAHSKNDYIQDNDVLVQRDEAAFTMSLLFTCHGEQRERNKSHQVPHIIHFSFWRSREPTPTERALGSADFGLSCAGLVFDQPSAARPHYSQTKDTEEEEANQRQCNNPYNQHLFFNYSWLVLVSLLHFELYSLPKALTLSRYIYIVRVLPSGHPFVTNYSRSIHTLQTLSLSHSADSAAAVLTPWVSNIVAMHLATEHKAILTFGLYFCWCLA